MAGEGPREWADKFIRAQARLLDRRRRARLEQIHRAGRPRVRGVSPHVKWKAAQR